MKSDMKILLETVGDLFVIEHPTSKSKINTLDGILKGINFIIENENGTKKNIDEKYFYILNRIIRNKFDSTYSSEFGYRNVEVQVPPLGDAINYKKIQPLMNRLFYQITDDEKDLSDIEKAALIRYAPFVIQPNGDGNKRTGVILSQKLLMESNLKPVGNINLKDSQEILTNFWKNMYSWEPFLSGDEIYNKQFYSPFVKHLSSNQ